MRGVGGDTVGGSDQDTADQLAMAAEKLANSSELSPGQPVLAGRVDKEDTQKVALGIARRFAPAPDAAAASKHSTGSAYPPCACGP